MASASVLNPRAPDAALVCLKYNRIDGAPKFGLRIDDVHHFHGKQFMRHRQVQPNESHPARFPQWLPAGGPDELPKAR